MEKVEIHLSKLHFTLYLKKTVLSYEHITTAHLPG